MKLIYLAHPYGGNLQNIERCENLEQKIQSSGYHIFNAASYFVRYENKKSEEEIMAMCLDMVFRCDELWLAPGWEDSPGCLREKERAKNLGIPIGFIKGGKDEWNS